MPDTHTIAEVAADEKLLRRLAGEVLNPGPWRHFWVCGHDPTRPYCLRCDEKKSLQNRDSICPAVRPAVGSLPDIAEALLRKVMQTRDDSDFRIIEIACEMWPEAHSTNMWRWLMFTPSERIACLLAVLLPEKVKVKHE